MNEPQPLWGYEDVAKYLGVSERWVGEQVNKGAIPSLLVGRRRRFMPREVELWAARQQVRT